MCSVFSVVPLRAADGLPSWEHPPHQQTQGIFWREHWYQRGEENHNPGYEKRLRVNPPEVVLHEKFGVRVEARENGLMLIKAEETLLNITAAEFTMEMWGGHPGTAGKRLSVNGRNTYMLPQMGAEDGHCTYSYPVLPICGATSSMTGMRYSSHWIRARPSGAT